MSIVPVVADMNHANSVNFSKLKAVGIWGVIHKARQGVGFKDRKYASRRQTAEGLGLLWAAYDFATGDDVAQNVKDFLDTAQPGPKTGMWLDFEDNSASEMSGDQAYEFLDRISQAIGRACGIYGGNRIREHIDAQSAKWIDLAKVSPLWQCRYIPRQPTDTPSLFQDIPPIPPWGSNLIIKYTADGDGPTPHTVSGLQDGADLSVFNGSYNELAAVWSGTPPVAA